MAWIEITESDVETRLAGAELQALKTAALATGQDNPLPEVIEQVIDEVRGYIAGNSANTLGAGTTIPSKLTSSALAMIRYRLCTRLPVKSLLTPQREQEYRDAIRLLERVSEGKFAVEEPTEDDTEIHSSPSPSIDTPTRYFSDQDGI